MRNYAIIIENYNLRLSCYNCNRYVGHDSDITLADAWNENDGDLGASKVYINTQKGYEIFERIYNDLIVKELSEKKETLSKYKHKYSMQNRRIFYKWYNRMKDHVFLFWVFDIKCLFTRIWRKFTG